MARTAATPAAPRFPPVRARPVATEAPPWRFSRMFCARARGQGWRVDDVHALAPPVPPNGFAANRPARSRSRGLGLRDARPDRATPLLGNLRPRPNAPILPYWVVSPSAVPTRNLAPEADGDPRG